ncbi:hypothetical protein R7P65_10655 [Vibrio sp. Vb0718]|uniref:hypothetical protein n=1 Tax=Vibrio sp. Vb0718 TaxID=3074630 RepID=UPI0029654AA3|nr:hypothetical protein [Vibrio sp. Vb0718]MDW1835730.1 hypothetical protein [Vibrio sp. Vb0718]
MNEQKLKFFSLDKHLDFDTVEEMKRLRSGGLMSKEECQEFMRRFLKRLSYTKLLSQLDCVKGYDIEHVDCITAHSILVSAMNCELKRKKHNIVVIDY